MSIKVIVLWFFVSFSLACLDPIVAESRSCNNDFNCERHFREDRRVISRGVEFDGRSTFDLESDIDHSREYRQYNKREEHGEIFRRNNNINKGDLQSMNEQQMKNVHVLSPASLESLQREKVSRNEMKLKTFNNLRNAYERIDMITRNDVVRNEMRRITQKRSRKDLNGSNREIRNEKKVNLNSLNNENRISFDILVGIDELLPMNMRNRNKEESRLELRSKQDVLERQKLDKQHNRKDNNRQATKGTNDTGESKTLAYNMISDRQQRTNIYQNYKSQVLDLNPKVPPLSGILYNVEIRDETNENSNKNYSRLTNVKQLSAFENGFTFIMQSSIIAILLFKMFGDVDKTQKYWETNCISFKNPIGF